MKRLLVLGSVLLACCGGEPPPVNPAVTWTLGGTELVYRAEDPALAGRVADVAIERLAALPVPAFQVVARPDGEVAVRVGPDADLDRVKALLARPGKLELRLYEDREGGETFTGADLDPDEVGVRRDRSGGFVVTFAVRPERRDAFVAFTGTHIDEKLAIVIDGVVRSAPVIRTALPGRGQISGGEGGFTKREAEDLAAALRGGVLPTGITLLRETSLGEPGEK